MKRSLPPPRRDLSGRIAWHYTVGEYLLKILDSGVIRTARTAITRGERPAVWFTLAEQWEETANKSRANRADEIYHMDREQTRAFAGGLIRFGIDAGVCHDWRT